MSFSFKAGILNLVEGSGGKNILKADVTKGMVIVVCLFFTNFLE